MPGAVTAAWTLGPTDGDLHILTGVAGPGAKMGHHLTIQMDAWQATVTWRDDEPIGAELSVDVGSLRVLEGRGGVTPLSGPEKLVVRSNALRSLDSKKYPTIGFTSDAITKTDNGYRLDGTVTIHGKSAPYSVELSVADKGDEWALAVQTPIVQTAFGIKPFSLLMGSLKVADEVQIQFSATRIK